jgi:hypothetical protein
MGIKTKKRVQSDMKDKVDMKLNNVFELANGMEEYNTMNNKFSAHDDIYNKKAKSDFFGLGGLLADGSVTIKYKGAEGPNSKKFSATIAKNQIYINVGIAGSPRKKTKNSQKEYPTNRIYGRFDSHQGSYKYYGAGIYKNVEVRGFMTEYNITDENLVSNQFFLTSSTQDDKTPYKLLDTNRLALGCIYASMISQRQVDNNYSLVDDSEYDDLIVKYWSSGSRSRAVTLIPHDIPNTDLGIIFITDRQ